jgi:hypothetical protein
MENVMLSRRGLRLDAPQVGDVVTVRVKPRPKMERTYSAGDTLTSLLGGREDEAFSPQHYRMNGLWRVKAVNGGQAVVEQLLSSVERKPEIWSIAHHEWFEASDLLDAMCPKTKMIAGDL